MSAAANTPLKKRTDVYVLSDDSAHIKNADVSKYISLPWMTKYEFDQVIGLRTMHLANGAVPFVPIPEDLKVKSNMELRKIAFEELKQRRLPYIIKRPMPNSQAEYWPVSKLSLDTVEVMM